MFSKVLSAFHILKDEKYSEKKSLPESFRNQDLNLPVGNHLRTVYTVLGILSNQDMKYAEGCV